MKYIIFESGAAVIFSDSTSHDAIADKRPVHSAGFCVVETYRNEFDDVRAKVLCYGKSESLGKTCQPGDEETLKRIFW